MSRVHCGKLATKPAGKVMGTGAVCFKKGISVGFGAGIRKGIEEGKVEGKIQGKVEGKGGKG